MLDRLWLTASSTGTHGRHRQPQRGVACLVWFTASALVVGPYGLSYRTLCGMHGFTTLTVCPVGVGVDLGAH